MLWTLKLDAVKRLFFTVCCVLLSEILFYSSSVFAAYSNYNSVLIGNQAAGMGGAYASLYSDISGLPWYNPANLVRVDGKSFSATVGLYKKFDIQYSEDNDIVRASLRINQGYFAPLPSATTAVFRPSSFLSGKTLSFSILSPDYYSYRGPVSNTNNNSTNISVTDQSLWVGGAISGPINSTSSWGFSLFYTARNFSKTVSDKTLVGGNQTKVYTEERALTQNSVVGILGYFKKLSDTINFGISYRPTSYHVTGKGNYSDAFIDGTTTVFSTSESEVSTLAKIPQKLSIGSSIEPNIDWLLSAQLDFYGKESYGDFENAQFSELIEHRELVNLSIGIQYTMIDKIKLRAGVFTNLSSHPNPNLNKVRGQGDHVDQLGVSSNIGFLSGPIEYTFGGYYTRGTGETSQRINQESRVIPKTEQVFNMLFGTAYYY